VYMVNNIKSAKGKNGAGFTIIELLVVVAIITVLTGIVLANITKYVNRGKNSAIQGNLSSLLINSAAYFEDPALGNGTYANLCATYMVSGKPIYDAIISANGGFSPVCQVNASNTAWCACSALMITANDLFCVDSTGTKQKFNDIGGCINICTASLAHCFQLP